MATSGLDDQVKIFYPTSREGPNREEIEKVRPNPPPEDNRLIDWKLIELFFSLSDCDGELLKP